jgi:hypothetical protein
MIWASWWNAGDLYRLFFCLMIIAVSMAHAILLLPLIERGRTVRTVVDATVGCIAVVALILLYLVLMPEELFGDDGLIIRILAVFAILDVLGTIVSPIMAKFLAPATPIIPPNPAPVTAPTNQKSPEEAQSIK